MTAPFAAPTALALAALSAGAAVVIEAEGALWDGSRALPGASGLLARLADRVAIVSNDARHTTDSYAARLAAAGLRVPPERVLTAGSAVIAAAATRFAGRRVMLLAPRGLVAAARALGIEPAMDQPDALVIADDTDLSHLRLCAAAAALAAGVPCLAACTAPRTADGSPGPGALVAALRAAVPDVAIESLGLPGPGILRHAAARAGAARGPAVLVADAGRAEAAQAAGMHLLPADHARLALAVATSG
jgi:ribonucleotide monophosphatase NagD (HAD superfamily)